MVLYLHFSCQFVYSVYPAPLEWNFSWFRKTGVRLALREICVDAHKAVLQNTLHFGHNMHLKAAVRSLVGVHIECQQIAVAA